MGGSAVAGDVLKASFRDRLGMPVDVNRSPVLPAFAGPRTLVVVSSYSGTTAETLAVVRRSRRARLSDRGGDLAAGRSVRSVRRAASPAVHVPGGFQPRAALGHLTFAALGALEAAGLAPEARRGRR